MLLYLLLYWRVTGQSIDFTSGDASDIVSLAVHYYHGICSSRQHFEDSGKQGLAIETIITGYRQREVLSTRPAQPERSMSHGFLYQLRTRVPRP